MCVRDGTLLEDVQRISRLSGVREGVKYVGEEEGRRYGIAAPSAERLPPRPTHTAMCML